MNIKMRPCMHSVLSLLLLTAWVTPAVAQLDFHDAEIIDPSTGRESLPPPPANGTGNHGTNMSPTDSYGALNVPAPLHAPNKMGNHSPANNHSGFGHSGDRWATLNNQNCKCGSCNSGNSLWDGYCDGDCSNCGFGRDKCCCDSGFYSRGFCGNVFGRNRIGCNDFFCGSVWPGTFTMFAGIDGSKQPQDFGVNANLGGLFQVNYAAPIFPGSNIGFQVGSSASFTGNAVQVYELLGESTDRFQSFNTIGIFQRTQVGFSWGAVYDFLYQESFDDFYLAQVRVRASFDVGACNEIGTTFHISARDDAGQFNNTTVYLDPIDQFNVYFRRYWQSGVNSAIWVGIAEEHSEENIVTGTRPVKNDTILFGADFVAPLNNCMALYGETNLMMPADTGAVDAFLGIEFSPQGIAQSRGRANPFRAYLPVAASPSFTTNLTR